MNAMNKSSEYSTEYLSKVIAEGQGFISLQRSLAVKNNSSESNSSSFLNETTTNRYNNNSEFSMDDWREELKPILDWMLLSVLIVIMLSMGCEITWQKILVHIKRPVGLCIGMFSQFGILPLSAYCILRVTSIERLHATGVLIISCCPAGVLSNTYTYFCDGDLSLSVAMTSFSTVLAMGMMPLNIWLYGRHFESDDLVIPYAKMSLSFISVTSPVLVGMLMKWKIPRVAAIITKVGSYCGILIMFICVVMETVLFPNMFTRISIKVYAVILMLPIIGLTLGYGLAYLTKQTVPVRKTISIECGVQNVPLALTVIAMSFPAKMQENLVLLPWLYGFSMMAGCTVICLAYHFYKKYYFRLEQAAETSKQVSLLEDPENSNR